MVCNNLHALKTQSMQCKDNDSQVKEKIPGAAVSKEDYTNLEGPMTIDFLEKAVTVNNASHCQLLKRNSLSLLDD